MNRTSFARKIATAAFALTTLVAVAGPVSAEIVDDSDRAARSISTPGGHGKTTYTWDYYRFKASGTADDITSGDSRCTYVYGQGRSDVFGWGSWGQKARACAGGTDAWSDTPTVYNAGYKIAVCNGPASNPGSASNCTRKVINA